MERQGPTGSRGDLLPEDEADGLEDVQAVGRLGVRAGVQVVRYRVMEQVVRY